MMSRLFDDLAVMALDAMTLVRRATLTAALTAKRYLKVIISAATGP